MSKIYLVGGAVRDSLMGLKSKDLDYTYVADSINSVEEAYAEMKDYMLSQGFKIFLETPDCLTIRAKFPDSSPHKGLCGDFVLARKEIGYYPFSRKPIVVPGTLKDDLTRRDFTINAMAKCIETGELIDLFEGQKHLKHGLLITPFDPMITLLDDNLRVLRALRFSVTLNCKLSISLTEAIGKNAKTLAINTITTVSSDRIRDELHKAFKYNSFKTFKNLQNFPEELVKVWLTVGNIWLMPTFKE